MIFTPLILYTQTAQDVKDLISTNDATIQGILIAIILALGSALIALYREKNKLQKEYVDTIKEYAENLRQVIESNRETMSIVEKFKS